jgi:hypothetical protein
MSMNSSIDHRHSVVVLGLLFAACGNGDDNSHRVRFDHLEVGQHVTYAVATGAYDASSGSSGAFSYAGETVTMEIAGHDDNGYRVNEIYAIGDTVQSGEYYLRIEQNKLHALTLNNMQSSFLLVVRNEYTFPLEEISEPVHESLGMTGTPDHAEYAEAAIIDGELLGVSYQHLNAVTDRTLVPGDGPASMWIYSATHGVVRTVHCGVEAMRCTAFDLQPE